MRAPVRGRKVVSAPVEATVEPMRLPLLLIFLGWLFKTTGRLIRWAFRHPAATLFLGYSAVVWRLVSGAGWWVYPVAAALVVGAGAGWRKSWPDSFRRHVVARTKGAFRAGTWYRLQWDAGCESMRLRRVIGDRRYLPRLVKVRSLGAVDTLTVRLLPGQTADEWAECSDALAHTFDAVSCRVKTRPEGSRQVLDLRMLSHDPFVKPVAPFKQTAQGVDLDALPVALREEGYPFEVVVRGNHFLLIGKTRSGKSWAMQYFIHALAPAVGAGLVRLHAIDMKGGVELVHVAPLCTSFVYKDPTEARDLLKRLVEEVMQPRLDRMRREGIRAHEPTGAEPLHVIPIDELAAITAYVTDTKVKKEIEYHLSLLLSQGLGAGLVLIAGVQDARKDVVSMRGLFTYRLAFALAEPGEVDMVLSRGARDRGARCDEITKAQQGVCYADVDGEKEPARLRFPALDTAQIRAAAAKYAVKADDDHNVVPLRQDEATAEQHNDGDEDTAA